MLNLPTCQKTFLEREINSKIDSDSQLRLLISQHVLCYWVVVFVWRSVQAEHTDCVRLLPVSSSLCS